jgi:hypothetical protein
MPSARVLLTVLCVLLGSVGPLAAVDAPEPLATRHQIDTWLKELGHPDYKVRDAAVRELSRRPEARSAVRDAAASASDPEVRGRAAEVLHAYYRLDRPKILARLKQMTRRKEADLVAELAVRYVGDDDPIWQAVTDFGWGSLGVAHDELGRLAEAIDSSLPDREFARFKSDREPEVLFPRAGFAASGSYLFRGARLALDRRATAPLVATTGPIDARGASCCFWLANGDVTLTGSATAAVLVSDGSIEARAAGRPRWTYLRSSLVVARGNINLPMRVTDCVILAGGNVDIPDGATLRSCTIRAGGRILKPEDWYEEEVEMIEDRRPGGATRPFVFFEPSRVGLTVASADAGVRLTAVEPGSPAAAAGLRLDDLVSALDGKRVDSPRTFRRLLRSAVVAGEGTFSLRRGEKDCQILVPFVD